MKPARLTVRDTVYLPAEVDQELRRWAGVLTRDMTSIVTEALRDWFVKAAKP